MMWCFRSAGVFRGRLRSRSRRGLTTGNTSSRVSGTAPGGALCGSQKRTATSIPSRARSATSLLAESRTSMSGCRARKRASRGTSHSAAKEIDAVTVTGRSSPSTDSRATACSMPASAPATARARVCPCSVSSSARFSRRNSATPSWSSSVLIWRLTADCVTCSSSAAFVKLRCRAAASKPRSRSREGRRGLFMAGLTCVWLMRMIPKDRLSREEAGRKLPPSSFS